MHKTPKYRGYFVWAVGKMISETFRPTSPTSPFIEVSCIEMNNNIPKFSHL